jgi:hypothetical protein
MRGMFSRSRLLVVADLAPAKKAQTKLWSMLFKNYLLFLEIEIKYQKSKSWHNRFGRH